MYLENVVIDAVEPQRLGRFWEAVVGGERLTDEPDAFETRLIGARLVFQRVSELPIEPPRLHLDLSGGARQAEEVDRLLGLGARQLDIGQGDVPWVVLADPEGNPCCVMEDRAAYAGSGPLAALPLDSADPDGDAEFWSWLTGWTDAAASRPGACAIRRGGVRSLSCALRQSVRSRPRTGCTSTFGLRLETIPTQSRQASSSAAAPRSTRSGASCRGVFTRTRRATSFACCQRGRLRTVWVEPNDHAFVVASHLYHAVCTVAADSVDVVLVAIEMLLRKHDVVAAAVAVLGPMIRLCAAVTWSTESQMSRWATVRSIALPGTPSAADSSSASSTPGSAAATTLDTPSYA